MELKSKNWRRGRPFDDFRRAFVGLYLDCLHARLFL